METRRNRSPTPLPTAFLERLAGHEEVLVTSREGDRQGTVPVWFIAVPPGVLYLFTFAFSAKARRWRTDPWIRLTVPGTRITAEGVTSLVHESADAAELEAIAPLVVERWGMQGAPTVEGLRRTIRDRTHALVRVEGC